LVESLSPGTRVVWIANSTGGTVQPDKTILWDDGSHMTHQQMRSSHALLIHSEAEWLSLNQTLSSMAKCLQCGCTLQRWDSNNCKADRPEKLCPLAVLADPEPSPPHMRRRSMRSARADISIPLQQTAHG
jgi:hypothetical protein